jgi:hypothetical protein
MTQKSCSNCANDRPPTGCAAPSCVKPPGVKEVPRG